MILVGYITFYFTKQIISDTLVLSVNKLLDAIRSTSFLRTTTHHMSKNKQPAQLHRGNKFHKKIQENWKKTAEGKVKPNELFSSKAVEKDE